MTELAARPKIPRATMATLGLFALAAVVLVPATGRDLPGLHSVLDSAMFVLSAVLALLLWQMGQTLDRPFKKYLAIAFAITAALELLHTVVSVEWSSHPELVARLGDLRPLTWPPPALLLPTAVASALWLLHRRARGIIWFAGAAVLVAIALVAFFQDVPPYAPPGWFGVTRPSLVLVPLLWAGTAYACWRARTLDRALPTLVLTSIAICIGSFAMLYSRAPHDALAMVAHLGRIAGYLGLLLSLMHMASLDMVERIRAEDALAVANKDLEARVLERTAALVAANQKAEAQLERLALLHQITRAIGERQDIDSIFQVAVRSLEDQLPVDFVCLTLYDPADNILSVARVGVQSAPLALSLAMPEQTRIEIDQNGLSRCVRGALVYEPDISQSSFPFPQRLASGGLRSFVAAPLQVESRVFGALVVARRTSDGFSSGECEFLRQLGEHVALAGHQAQLYSALKQAYDELRQTQAAVMQQERLRALGQMASGIAHDINNALSPIALYTSSVLETDPGLSPASRNKLEIVERAIDDAAHTVSRMKDFYYQRESEIALAPVDVETLFQQVIDLTQARWRDMAQERGVTYDLRIEIEDDAPTILGVENELREALVNLVFNAIDAMPNGGAIALRARLEGERNDRIAVEVADQGVGMDETTRQRCLEPFFTTKGEHGTGLGLAMVYGAARRHGGDIVIESAPGRGTIVRLSLAAAPVGAATPSEPAAVVAPTRRLRLLVVDDDPILLRSLRDVLEGDGHVVTTASDGENGVASFKEALTRSKRFDAVITDLGMPKMDGRRVAGAIKELDSTAPVILLTGWGERLIAEKEHIPNIDIVLSKPPKARDIRLALARCCEAESAKQDAP